MLCLIAAGVAAHYGNKELDPYREIAAEYDLTLVGEKEEMSFIHDRGGVEIGTMFVENRFSIPLEEIPMVFVDAVLAQEDQRFYAHDGVDWIGVARAAWLNFQSGSITQGAGTITMQLARKSFDLQGEAKRREWTGYERKVVEAFVALRIEDHFRAQLESKYPSDDDALKKAAKEDILEMYLNLVPFGSGFFGVRSASLGYFGKEPKDLTISESASIVACLKNPQRISPLNDLGQNKTNRDMVLTRMALEGMISEADRNRMISKPVVLSPNPIRRGKSFLYEIVREQARDLVGEEALSRGGYTIRTTIDAAVQRAAEEKMARQLLQVESQDDYKHPRYTDYDKSTGPPNYLQGATLMMDHETGEVIAHVGGRNYAHSQYDFIQSGSRPLGTAFFPFVYATGFEKGRHPATIVTDAQMDLRKLQVGGLVGVAGEWGMEVANPGYEGKITSRRALATSKIAASVELGQQIGLSNVHEVSSNFGFTLPSDNLLNRMIVGFDKVSMPEVVSAYSAFPRGGSRVTARHYILEIRDIDGRVVYPLGGNGPVLQTKAVCSDAAAFQVHSVLNDVMRKGNLADSARGLKSGLLLGGGKSGTAYGLTDAWMVGYNSRITCAVWVGFYEGDRKAIHETAFAKNVAYPIWEDMMNASQPAFAGREILPPESVEKVSICRVSGMRPTQYCNESFVDPVTGQISFPTTSYQEYLRKGQEMGICAIHGGGVDIEALAEQAQVRNTLNAIPIKAKVPLLLGFDPYNSETPTLGIKDDSAEAWISDDEVLVVEDQVRGEGEALLKLPLPPSFVLPPPDPETLINN
ncbi:MAG: transglycosylase domain-containing protein [Akkermansiaceae bacterium]